MYVLSALHSLLVTIILMIGGSDEKAAVYGWMGDLTDCEGLRFA
jgi:hypothetical protein